MSPSDASPVAPNSPGTSRVATTGRWVVFGAAIGVLAGIGAVLFHLALHYATELVLFGPTGYRPPLPAGELAEHGHRAATGAVQPLWIVLVPALGGLLTGFLTWAFCRDAVGEGTDGMIGAFHRHDGRVSLRVVWVKLLASVSTIASGGSAGREGPSAQIGGAIGSQIAGWFRLGDRDRRFLLLAGAAAGVGAIFRAPLGGALYAGEVLYGDTDSEADALIPCLIASIIGYSVFIGCLGTATLFDVPDGMVFERPGDLLWYGVLGVLCAVVGGVFVRSIEAMERVFERLLPWHVMRPALGGGLLGALALGIAAWLGDPHNNVLGGGHGLIQVAMDGNFAVWVAITLVVGKMLATGLTVGSGGSGGLFAPSLVIGALLGGAFGTALAEFGVVEHPAPFVMVGMAGFFSGVGKVPVTAVVMICEITKGYELLVPIMLAAVISFLLSRGWSLYRQQVPTRLDSPAHAGDFVVDVLEQLRVADVMDSDRQPTFIAEDTPLRRVLTLVAQSDSRYFPVVNDDGEMIGIFSLTDIRRVMNEVELANLVLAKEIATEDVLTVEPDTDLNTALRFFTMKNIDELPVVHPEAPGQVIGLLSRKDMTGAYWRRVAELKEGSS